MMRCCLATLLFAIFLGLLPTGWIQGQEHSPKHHHGVQKQPFGTHDGRPINLYTLTNSQGLEIRAMNYGGIILSVRVPDRKGQFADIVLGHDTLEGYIPNPPYFVAILDGKPNRFPT